MMSIVEQLFRFGVHNPEKVALLNGKQSQTYEELLKGILYAKDILEKKYGIRKGDRIILAADKQMEFVSVYFACHLLETVALPIAPDTNAKRYKLIQDKVMPSLVVGFSNTDNNVNNADLSDFSGAAISINLEEVSFPELDSIADIILSATLLISA